MQMRFVILSLLNVYDDDVCGPKGDIVSIDTNCDTVNDLFK